MRIHSIQTGRVVVKKSQQQGGRGRGVLRLVNTMLDPIWTEPLPILAWVIEHPEGVIVIDTGETARTAEPGYFPWWHPYFKLGVQASVKPGDEIGPQLRALGIPPAELRWLVMTHLHTDHAGGLYHFPQSEIFVSREEYELASGLMGRLRGYLPHHWPAWFKPRLVDFNPEPVGPFPESFTLTKAGDVHLVPTPGHTDGHLSVILQQDGLSYFFAGDASYTEQMMLDQIVDGVSLNIQIARQSLKRIHHYVQARPTVYLPSHDPGSAKRLATRQPVFPEHHPLPQEAALGN
ncbi:MAG: N-acyl homoserine lactonase family protein [Chloroflexota bacterium]|nr:MAG: N-acyl homoserine lactonase family protein [Chloroflexota bacterium]